MPATFTASRVIAFLNGEIEAISALWSSVDGVMWCNIELSKSVRQANSVHERL